MEGYAIGPLPKHRGTVPNTGVSGVGACIKCSRRFGPEKKNDFEILR